ncbi:MAG: hypothetical protein KKD44_26175 [Proteobacteria bacterium]|nr:hypothetical protein [Pseudomonadota bacterium]
MGTKVEPIMGLLRNYLPLAGGTMTGNITIGSNLIKGTSASIRDDGYSIQVRNLANDDYFALVAKTLSLMEVLTLNGDGFEVNARNADNNYVMFKARDNGVDRVEVARLQGAAAPYLQATLGIRLSPVTSMAAVEGMLRYDNTQKKLVYRDDSGEKTMALDIIGHVDNVVAEANTERSKVDANYTKVKEILLKEGGTYQVNFDLKTSNAGETAYGRIYKNGVAHGTEQTDVTAGYVTKAENLTFTAGDLVQLYYKSTAGFNAFVRNLNIKGYILPDATVNTD